MSLLSAEFNARRVAAYAMQKVRRQTENAKYTLESRAMDGRRDHLLSLMRPAQRWEYDAWLTGFLQAGGKVTQFDERPWPGFREFYTALADFTMLPLYGARAVDIIVPKGINLLGGDTGHCHLFITASLPEGPDRFMFKGFHDKSPHFSPYSVTAYSDTELLA